MNRNRRVNGRAKRLEHRKRYAALVFACGIAVFCGVGKAGAQAPPGRPPASGEEAKGQAPDTQVQAQSPAPRAEDRPPYNILRQEEDWRSLRDLKRRTDTLDGLKFIPLGKRGWLTLGGQTRQFYEYLGNESWGAAPIIDNNYLLQRYHLSTDFHFNETLRFYFELKSGITIGRTGGPRGGLDQDDLDTHQAFFEVSSPPRSGHTEAPFTLRVGRQELNYGAGRLVSVREGPNVRVGFDGLFGIARSGAWRMDAFTTRPVATRPRFFDDGTNYSQLLWGVYATGPLSAKRPAGTSFDLYYLGQERLGAAYDRGIGNERRHTVGFRLYNTSAPFDYDIEPSYQFGSFGGSDIDAWGGALNVGYTVPHNAQKLRLGLTAGINSGDRNPAGHTLNTFSPPAPSGLYFGQVPSLGPQNVMGFSPSIRLQPLPKLTLTLSDYFFWRQSLNDGIYALNGAVLKTGQLSRASYVGSQPELNLLWQIDRHSSLTLDVAQFVAGDFLRETPPGKDVHYFGAWFTFLF